MRSALIFAGGVVVGAVLTAGGLWLGVQYTMRQVAEMQQSATPDTVRQMVKAGADLQTAKTEYERWLALGNVALWNVDAGALHLSRAYAEKLLDSSERFKNDWNYGNAVHKAHLAMGRVDLRQGNKVGAKEHLLAAGRTPGSPQLNTFGPNMLLAKDLLQSGEPDAVLEYLDLCQKFWKMDMGALDTWRRLIKEGKTPNFGANLLY